MTVAVMVQIVGLLGGFAGLAAFFKVLSERTQVKEQATNLMVDSSTQVMTNLRTENAALMKVNETLKTDLETSNGEIRTRDSLDYQRNQDVYKIRAVLVQLLQWSENTYNILTPEQKLSVGKPPSVQELM